MQFGPSMFLCTFSLVNSEITSAQRGSYPLDLLASAVAYSHARVSVAFKSVAHVTIVDRDYDVITLSIPLLTKEMEPVKKNILTLS